MLAVIKHDEGLGKVDLPVLGRGKKVVNLNGGIIFENGSYELTPDGRRIVDGKMRNVYAIKRVGEPKPEDELIHVNPLH